MRVCYFGSYNRNYSRNSIIIKGLQLNGIKIDEIRFKPSYFNYFKVLLKLLKSSYDVIICGFSINRGLENIIARIGSRKPIIWDVFFSQYDNIVLNWQSHDINSHRAKRIYYAELFNLKLSNCVILDTNAHIQHFKRLFPIKNTNYERIFIGADDTVAFPQNYKRKTDKFILFFSGYFNPLHGIEHIIDAAKILRQHKDIQFNLVGGGYLYKKILELRTKHSLNNIQLAPLTPYPETIQLMNQADVCLGIFGITKKTDNVIPNKVYDALAIAKPIITSDTTAIQELLEDKINCLLCKRGDGTSIAEAILLLKEDESLREKIASNGYALFKKKLTPTQIGKSLVRILEKFI